MRISRFSAEPLPVHAPATFLAGIHTNPHQIPSPAVSPVKSLQSPELSYHILLEFLIFLCLRHSLVSHEEELVEENMSRRTCDSRFYRDSCLGLFQIPQCPGHHIHIPLCSSCPL